jgi:ELWxxDGT repeat protein
LNRPIRRFAVVLATSIALPVACWHEDCSGQRRDYAHIQAAQTAGQASLVKDVRTTLTASTTGGVLTPFLSIGTTTFFAAGDAETGTELWKTDGTAAGTQLVKDIDPGPNSSFPHSFANLNGKLLFTADDGTTGTELWQSDGTRAGTTLVAEAQPGPNVGSDVFISGLTACGGAVYYPANDFTHGSELWRSDGTTEGTGLVLDIQPGATGSSPTDLTCLNGVLYFQANDGAHGTELWRSDGTAVGTVLLLDINAGPGDSTPTQLTAVGSNLFFTANDGSSGIELWITDGTPGGGARVADLSPGAASTAFLNPMTVNDVLLIAVGGPTTTASFPSTYALYRSDGTAAGTFAIGGAVPNSPEPTSRAVVNGVLYFSGKNTAGDAELWVSDGTSAGTNEVANLNANASSGPTDFLAIGSTLFFAANTTAGMRWFKSDGTAAGTVTLPGAGAATGLAPSAAALSGHLVFATGGFPY